MPIRKSPFILCALSILIVSCNFSYPIIDLTQPDFKVESSFRMNSTNLVITTAADVKALSNFDLRPNYNMFYRLSGSENRYVNAVSNSLLGKDANRIESNTQGKVVLQLTSMQHNLFLHDSGDLPDVTDEITAEWKLFDPNGKLIKNFVVIGQQTAETEWGISAAPESARVRGLDALRNLYQQTMIKFSQSTEIKQLTSN